MARKPTEPIGLALQELGAREGLTREKLAKSETLLGLLPDRWPQDLKLHVMTALIIHLASSVEPGSHRTLTLAALNVDGTYAGLGHRARIIRARRMLDGEDTKSASGNPDPEKDKKVYDTSRNMWEAGRDKLAILLSEEVARRKSQADGWADLLDKYRATSLVHESVGGRATFRTITMASAHTRVEPEVELNDPLPDHYAAALIQSGSLEVSCSIRALFEYSPARQCHRLIATQFTHTIHEVRDYNVHRQFKLAWLVGHGHDAPYRPRRIYSATGSRSMSDEVEFRLGDKRTDGSVKYISASLETEYPGPDKWDPVPENEWVAYLGQDWSAHNLKFFVHDDRPSDVVLQLEYSLVGGGYFPDDAPFFLVRTPASPVVVRSLDIGVAFADRPHPVPFYPIYESNVRTETPYTYVASQPIVFKGKLQPNQLYGIVWVPRSR